jgi:transcriptional regulator with XRE-family HTH domain
MKARDPKPVDVELGLRIRKRRNEIHMTQVELGARIGVSFQQIQKYERGANRITVSTVIAIANVLDVDCRDFFGGLQDYVVLLPAAKQKKGSSREKRGNNK